MSTGKPRRARSKTDPETIAEPSDSQAPEQSRIHGLVVVATPIGNASDISLRALAVLKTADAILCEDTRVSAKLLARHGIRRPLPWFPTPARRSSPTPAINWSRPSFPTVCR
jgi:hypothetical protein